MTEIVPYVAESIEFYSSDDVFIKMIKLDADVIVPQHSHAYEHGTLVAVGSVRAWCDGALLGDFRAPTMIPIKANAKHTFASLEPTILYCIHNVMRTGKAEIVAEHKLGDAWQSG